MPTGRTKRLTSIALAAASLLNSGARPLMAQAQQVQPPQSAADNTAQQAAKAKTAALEAKYADILKDGKQDDALIDAVEHDDLDAARFLLQKNANPNVEYKH